MRSPFPGMDPYLEDHGGWTGVHDGLIALIRTDLNRQLGPDFVADAGTSVYIVAPDERRWAFPDVYIVAARSLREGGAGQRITAPVEVLLAAPESVSQPHVAIRDRASRQVVTIVEVLSPINKAPEPTRARQEFLRKRADVLASGANWVEIDLLRGGERPPEVRGSGDYYALGHRAGAATALVWPIGLRDALPGIGVPLRAGAADVPLELQALLDQLYAEGRYADLIDYATAAPPPALTADDARWVTAQIGAWRAERTPQG